MLRTPGYPIFLVLAFILVAAPVRAQIAFQERASSYGINHRLERPTIGAGISVYDFNKDGLDDLTLATFAGKQISFYQNTGSGFERIAPLIDNLESVKQINWVDFDNDGDPDLYVAANDGISRLYENKGELILIDITEQSGLPLDRHFGYGACWGDYNRDGWLDLYYASKGIIGDPDAIKSYNRLFKNNADGTFTEKTFEAGASDEGKLPFCAAFIDYNNDLWPDIYIANDKLTFNTLLHNTGHEAFVDVSIATGANSKMNAMCVNPGDYNNDGWMDIYITNTPVGSHFLKNSGRVNEEGFIQLNNIAKEVGVDFPGGNCWGSNFLDADNDGDLDLYVSSSIPSPKDVSSAFFENSGNDNFMIPFIEGFQKDTASSYTNAIGDFNNDGRIDIMVENDPPYLFNIWENQTENSNHWIKLHLEGVLSNKDGIGTRIESYTNGLYQMQYTLCGSGFLGQNSSFKHFGLGNSSSIDSVIITWPTGHIDKLFNLLTNQTIYVLEGQSTSGRIDVDENISIVEKRITTPVIELNNVNSSIFPNPGQDKLNIRSELIMRRIEFYNLQGQLHESYELDASDFSIFTDKFTEGIYLLKIWYNQSEYEFLRWIKI